MQKNPSHHLVEVNIDKNDAGDILERAFFGEITNTSRTCWSQRNVNRHKNLNHGGNSNVTLNARNKEEIIFLESRLFMILIIYLLR